MQPSESYVIENYGQKSTFSSFLPGICGVRGIPIWSFYVNRGQAIASFGVNNKENAIMEFSPAHQSYQTVKTTGFRTFVKKDGAVFEPFSDETVPTRMRIFLNALELEEDDAQHGLRTQVGYFTLPGERVGALVRTLTVTNTSDAPAALEILDGMSALIPHGVPLSTVKAIGQTAKAWMQVEDVEARAPYFRARASLEDSAEVSAIEAGHFALGFEEDGALLPVLVDPALIFSYDTSLRRAVRFEREALPDLRTRDQVTANEFPCCFFGKAQTLAPGERLVIRSLYGLAYSKDMLRGFLSNTRDGAYFAAKRAEADRLILDLTAGVATGTACATFDAYCRANFMDNLLRGGYPMRLGKDKVFYAYSRKHGDLERDYNFFSMLPEYYSQGNGNFRDVNQNRRCDTFFAPFVGRENIDRFYSLIQLDGYNPLLIEKLTYRLPIERAQALAGEVSPRLVKLLEKPVTPGALRMALEDEADEQNADALFDRLMDEAQSVVNEAFGEGYWCDHWTYNLDLVEDYLEVFPDRERELLFDETLTCFLSQANVNPRGKRYVETAKGLRQYRALDESSRRDTGEKLVRTRCQTGDVLRMSLLEKLALLCAVKFATLDAYGMGVEMEGGKPGWYDALNGLPGMFGSSMNETYELGRMLSFTIRALQTYGGALPVLSEVAELIAQLDAANRQFRGAIHACDGAETAQDVREGGELLPFWNRINDIKEAYRARVFAGISGEKTPMDAQALARALSGFADTVSCGIRKAKLLSHGVIPSYFAYDVTDYRVCQDGIEPLRFSIVELPPFLEGTVRYLKLPKTPEEKRACYRAVRESDLYDRKLRMYKVNASLSSASYELGRAVAFVPGWLENESVWLHMEYKYLLEILRSGLYREFFDDLRAAAVPFLDGETYGRSVYENSSFIVSSANPNPALHGKGFVARLSGSTVEFISIWKRMMFGPAVLSLRDGELVFSPQPALPAYLIPEDGLVRATLFGGTRLDYRFASRRDYVPGKYAIRAMTFVYADGRTVSCEGPVAAGGVAQDLRAGKVRSVRVDIA